MTGGGACQVRAVGGDTADGSCCSGGAEGQVVGGAADLFDDCVGDVVGVGVCVLHLSAGAVAVESV